MKRTLFVLLSVPFLLFGCAWAKEGMKAATTPDPGTGVAPIAQMAHGAVETAMNPTSLGAWSTFLGGAGAVAAAFFGKKVLDAYHGSIADTAVTAAADALKSVVTPVKPV